MVKNLSGKTAIVTGSSRGIGGIAIDLAKRGANVVVNYTSPRGAIAGEEVVKEIEDAGSKVALVQANVTFLSDLRKLVEAALTLSASGKIDILVHNAATGDDSPIFLTQLTLPHIARGGRIILVSSVSARMGMPQQTVYAGTKAALEGIVKVWATELDMWTECEPDIAADFQPVINATPAAARVGEVSDIVPIVSFLCSEDSRWVTGSAVSASGGMNFI
ncbi:hypothetical protein BGZ57DRAFT_1013956 [Hyaloscypha finlandica]|nr:hypothetical protein BGZ57DRAFT_1013956 [Hyaloscypha finlandica]